MEKSDRLSISLYCFNSDFDCVHDWSHSHISLFFRESVFSPYTSVIITQWSPNFLFFTHFSSRIQSAIYGSSSLMIFLFFFDRGPFLEPLVKVFLRISCVWHKFEVCVVVVVSSY